jgi:hypothetical protein
MKGAYAQQLQQQSAQMDAKSSPSKAAAKFATKQEIANTYMNKTEAFQKYRLMQNGTPVQLPNQMNTFGNTTDDNENISTSTSSSLNANNNSQPPSSTSSSIVSMSSPLGNSNVLNPQQQQLNMSNSRTTAGDNSFNQSTNSNNDTLTMLPSHLKLEFDKMKYLPDMVKTIKKRHSISEIEGSGNTIPPLIVQKLLEKHKEFNNLNNHR